MKKILIYLKISLFLCLAPYILQAQNECNWIANLGNIYSDNIQAISSDTNGDMLLVLNLDNDSDAVFNNYSAIIDKFSPDGSMLFWEVYFEIVSPDASVETKAVATDSNNDVYVVGEFDGMISFHQDIFEGDYDIFIAKLDGDNGDLLWFQTANNTEDPGFGPDFLISHYDRIHDIAVDANNNIYVTGQIGFDIHIGDVDIYTGTNSSQEGDMFILKLNQNGVPLWGQSAAGSLPDYGKAVAVDNQNNVYVTGMFAIALAFSNSNTVLESQSNYDFFVAKYNTNNGSLLWAEAGVSGFDVFSQDIAVDNQNNIYITGDFSGSFDFSNTTVSTSADDFLLNPHFYILKMDVDANVQWVHTAIGVVGATSRTGEAIVIDDSNQVYVAGDFAGLMNFDNGDSFIGDALNSLFVVKYDHNGNYLGATHTSSPSDDFGGDNAKAMALSQNNNLWIVGELYGTLEWEGVVLETLGATDGIVWSLCTNQFVGGSIGLNDFAVLEKDAFFIKNANNVLQNKEIMQLQLTEIAQKEQTLYLSICNIDGHILKEQKLNYPSANVALKMPTSLTNGIYFLTLYSKTQQQTMRFVKQ